MIFEFPYHKCQYINQNILLEEPTFNHSDPVGPIGPAGTGEIEETNLQDFIKNLSVDMLSKPPLPFDILRKYTAVSSTSYIFTNNQYYFGGRQVENPFEGNDQILNWIDKYSKNIFNILAVISAENGRSSMEIVLYDVEGKPIDDQNILLE